MFFFKEDFIYLSLEQGGGREKEREKNISVWLPLERSLLGVWSATQACADWELNWPATLWFTGRHPIH